MLCGSALAPVIQFVTNLVYNLMKAIQSVVYALFKVNIFANAGAKAYSKMANSAGKASKASKTLSSTHSDINNINTSSGGSGAGNVTPNMDLSKMDTNMVSWFEKWKPLLEKFFEPIKNSWNNYGQGLIESAKNSLSSMAGLVQSIGKSFAEVWLNGTGEATVSSILRILTSVFNVIGNISNTFKNAWEGDNKGTQIVQNLWNAFNNLLGIIEGVQKAFEEWTASESFQLFANAIIGIIQTLSGWFDIITAKLREIWENGGKETFTSLLEFIGKVVEIIDVVLKALEPVVSFATEQVGRCNSDYY